MTGILADTAVGLINWATYLVQSHPQLPKPVENVDNINTIFLSVVKEGAMNGINYFAFPKYKAEIANALCVAAQQLIPAAVSSCKDAIPFVSQVITAVKTVEVAILVLRLSAKSHKNWGDAVADCLQTASHWYQFDQLNQLVHQRT